MTRTSAPAVSINAVTAFAALLLPLNIAVLFLVETLSFDLEAFGWWAGLVVLQVVSVTALCGVGWDEALNWLRFALYIVSLAAGYPGNSDAGVRGGCICTAHQATGLPNRGGQRFVLASVPVFWLSARESAGLRRPISPLPASSWDRCNRGFLSIAYPMSSPVFLDAAP